MNLFLDCPFVEDLKPLTKMGPLLKKIVISDCKDKNFLSLHTLNQTKLEKICLEIKKSDIGLYYSDPEFIAITVSDSKRNFNNKLEVCPTQY